MSLALDSPSTAHRMSGGRTFYRLDSRPLGAKPVSAGPFHTRLDVRSTAVLLGYELDAAEACPEVSRAADIRGF